MSVGALPRYEPINRYKPLGPDIGVVVDVANEILFPGVELERRPSPIPLGIVSAWMKAMTRRARRLPAAVRLTGKES